MLRISAEDYLGSLAAISPGKNVKEGRSWSFGKTVLLRMLNLVPGESNDQLLRGAEVGDVRD